MLKNSASGVLASLKPSTYSVVRLGLSLAAAFLTILQGLFPSGSRRAGHRSSAVPKWFFHSLLAGSLFKDSECFFVRRSQRWR
jgi:hypothetical protein